MSEAANAIREWLPTLVAAGGGALAFRLLDLIFGGGRHTRQLQSTVTMQWEKITAIEQEHDACQSRINEVVLKIATLEGMQEERRQLIAILLSGKLPDAS